MVTFAGVTGYKEVKAYHGVMATSDHKFFDRETGMFIPAQKMTNGYELLSLKELIGWKAKLLSSTGKPISETRRADIISSTQQEMRREKAQNNYTAQFGNTTMVKYRKAITYIMWMAISTITTFPTWSVYRLGNIYRSMLTRMKKILSMLHGRWNILKRPEKLQNNGIKATQDANGIGSTLNSLLGRSEGTDRINNASSAEVTSRDYHGQDFAVQAVKKKHGGVEKKKVPVYNLTVSGAGCYYANGVLVSNCDSAACIARHYDRKSGTPYKSAFGG